MMKRTLLLLTSVFFLLVLFSGCKKSSEESNPNLIGLAMPVQLNYGENILYLTDLFRFPDKIDSISTHHSLSYRFAENKHKLFLEVADELPPLTNMRVYTGPTSHDILLKAPNKKQISLVLDDEGYAQVSVKGEMNAWNTAAGKMTKIGSKWRIQFELSPGRYQYLFVADGKELLDPRNDKTAPNGMGGVNSLLILPKPSLKELPALRTASYQDDSITIRVRNDITEAFIYWNNQRLEYQLADEEITLTLPPDAEDQARSHVRAWAFNSFGASNDLFIPLHKGQVIFDTKDLNRSDFRSQVMYFTLVDRFHNGNPDNDDPVQDDRLTRKTNYWGGDLAGITEKIKSGYFDSLSMNTIWLSPITQNPLVAYQEYPEPRRWYSGYHGYWPISSSEIDHRFGTPAELTELIDAAHKREMNVLLDYVCNHIHKEHPIYQQHPDWVTEVDLPGGKKNIRIWEEHRLTTWFDIFLPSLDLSDSTVIEVQSDSALFWLENYELDGFRHDATKHVPLKFWRTLTHKIREEIVVDKNRPVYQIGETFGSRELIQQYIGNGLLDAQFDFNLFFDARSVIGKEDLSFELLAASLRETFDYYGHHNQMGYISGNHDIARFISLAGGSLKWDENDREAGFEREIGVGDPKGYKMLQMLHAFNFGIPGIPVVYYGDEIGMPGANDPDNRRPMKFSGLTAREKQTRETVSKLGQLRSEKIPLIYGDTEILLAEERSFALIRSWFGKHMLVVFNGSDQAKELLIPLPDLMGASGWKSHFDHPFRLVTKHVQVELPPYSFDYISIQ